MSLKTKAFIYQLISFALIFIPIRIGVSYFTDLEGFWPPFIAFVATLLLAPKFQAVQSSEGDELFMRWVFMKGIRKIE